MCRNNVYQLQYWAIRILLFLWGVCILATGCDSQTSKETKVPGGLKELEYDDYDRQLASISQSAASLRYSVKLGKAFNCLLKGLYDETKLSSDTLPKDPTTALTQQIWLAYEEECSFYITVYEETKPVFDTILTSNAQDNRGGLILQEPYGSH